MVLKRYRRLAAALCLPVTLKGESVMERRKDYGNNADAFFDSLSSTVVPLARQLRGIIRKAIPKASESIKWSMPVYEAHKMVCAVRISDDYVALQLYTSGTNLHDPDGLLEGTGKRMRHVKVRSKADIRKGLFTSCIKQTVDER
jgi:hypothetical protein